jgi:hypothetical protein
MFVFMLSLVSTGEGFGGSLTKEFLVIVLASEVLGPVLTSHWLHEGLDEDDDYVLPVIGIEGHGHPLPRSEVTTFHSVTMGMDAFLFLSLPPQ